MHMAKVIGNVVATRKDKSLVGYKLMVVKKINTKCEFIGDEEVAADYVGAGIGEYVLLCKGSAVRVDEQKHNIAVDLAIIGIIDNVDA
ncbi:MAG: EutN/CcmL family microcompartment protein [Clostridioides difficile]|nr:EutN/CcmL family microcompartment protein [Clostridium butyricum]MCQ2013443.1 EutN/CcmL family microcompartment protein [Clostridium butyricum]MCQ2027708.1 EutN/CcmL family microcompartment protein [Clostridium butyricum]MDU4853156.1 EutN/CcmL family microcompartment protein [Clostridioides difficile]